MPPLFRPAGANHGAATRSLNAYTDGINAKYWKKKIENETQQDMLDKLLKKTFPEKKIPKPIETNNYYWDDGMTYWKKHIDAKKIAKNMIRKIIFSP